MDVRLPLFLTRSNTLSATIYSIELQAFTSEIEQFLDGALLGTPGGIRYRVHRLKSMQFGQQHTYYVSVYRRASLLGVVGLVQRFTEEQTPWIYIRYLYMPNGRTLERTHKPKQIPAANSNNGASKHSILESLIQDKIASWIRDMEIKGSGDRPSESSIWAYAFVECKNLRSIQLCERFGFSTQQHAETILFHRFRPKPKHGIHQLSGTELDEVIPKLRNFYGGYSAFHTEGLKEQGAHWVYRENDELKAYARVMRHQWDIEELPGYLEVVKKCKLHHLPFIKDMIPSDNFEFLSFDYLWCKPENAPNLQAIMEHALSLEGLHVGLSWWALNSSFYQSLKKDIHWGILNYIQGQVPLFIMGKAYTSATEKESRGEAADFPEGPVFINAHDMT